MASTEAVRVTIFNQNYSLVASEEPGRIEHLAHRVDELMSNIAKSGNMDSTRAAVLACLHLADKLDLLETELTDLKNRVDNKAERFKMLLDEAIGV